MRPEQTVTVKMAELHQNTAEVVRIAAQGVPVRVLDGRTGKVRAWLLPPDHELAVPA